MLGNRDSQLKLLYDGEFSFIWQILNPITQHHESRNKIKILFSWNLWSSFVLKKNVFTWSQLLPGKKFSIPNTFLQPPKHIKFDFFSRAKARDYTPALKSFWDIQPCNLLTSHISNGTWDSVRWGLTISHVLWETYSEIMSGSLLCVMENRK